MYNVTINMHYLEEFGEMLPGDRADAEDHLRELLKHILLEFFIAVAIDQISIYPLAGSEGNVKGFSVHITAHCVSKTYPFAQEELMRMELALEDRISCALLELVGMLDVEDISIENPPAEEKEVLTYRL